MKKITILSLIAVFFIMVGCKTKKSDEADIERSRLLEMLEGLYDENGVLVSHTAAEEAISAFRVFGNNYPEDSLALVFHTYSGDISEMLGKYALSREIFIEIAELHPEDEIIPYIYYRIGTLSNDELEDTETAEYYFNLIITEYPDNEFADGARFGIETLGMDKEEQLEYLLEKSAKIVADSIAEEQV